MGDHALRHVKHRHDDVESVGEDQDGTSGFEYPLVDIRHVKLVHIVLFQDHLDQLIGRNKGQDQPGNRQDHRFGKLRGSGRTPRRSMPPGVVPTCTAISPTLGIDRYQTARSRFPMIPSINSSLSHSVIQSVRIPMAPPLKQGRQQGDQGRAQQDDAAARHELLDPLAFGRRVVRAVALQQIDHAPHAQASAQGHHQGLQGSNSRSKKLPYSLHFSGCMPRP